MNRTLKTVVFWLVAGISAMLLWQVVRAASDTSREGRVDEISYSRFLSQVDAGTVESVTISGQQIRGWYREGRDPFTWSAPAAKAFIWTRFTARILKSDFRIPRVDPFLCRCWGRGLR